MRSQACNKQFHPHVNESVNRLNQMCNLSYYGPLTMNNEANRRGVQCNNRNPAREYTEEVDSSSSTLFIKLFIIDCQFCILGRKRSILAWAERR